MDADICPECKHSVLAHNGLGCKNEFCSCGMTVGKLERKVNEDQLSLF